MRKLLYFFLIFFIMAVPVAASETTMEVYRDGYVHIEQTIDADPFIGAIDITLLSETVENLLIVDSDDIPLNYEVNGITLTIFTLGEEVARIYYDTPSITSKEGALWGIALEADDTTHIILPEESTIIYLSPMPEKIDLSTNSVYMGAGSIEITYIFGPETENKSMSWYVMVLFIVAIISIIGYVLIKYHKRPKKWKYDDELDIIENKIMEYLYEHDSAFESEIRTAFNIPKTSSWRMMRRLEQKEYIILTKKNKLNLLSVNKRS
ncbi:MAG: helix-turn-helix transcriptional regulator [Candidatus Methanofastidiosia archaeon]